MNDEQRAAPGASQTGRVVVDDQDAVAEAPAVPERMAAFSNNVRDGRRRRHTGGRIRNREAGDA
jgi:hypothetical protein